MPVYPILLACLAFIVYVEGLLNPFWVWNALPIGFTALFVKIARGRGSSEIPALAFGVGAVGITVYAHLAWLFDWDQIASGSSTSGLLFIVLPIMALGAGAILFAIAWTVVWLQRR